MTSWWRQHWRLGLALIVTAVGLFAMLLLYALRKRQEAQKLQVQLGLLNASMRVAGLEADKAARVGELAQNAEAATALDAEIAKAKTDAVAIAQSVKGMSDAEIAEAFKKLGY